MKMSPVRYAACVCLLLLPLHLGYAASALTGERIAALLRAEDPEALATVSGQTVYGAPLIRQMYAARGYEPLWSVEAIVAFSDALDRLEADGLTPGDYRFAEIAPQLGTPDMSALGPAEAAEVDILLTEAFVRATYNLYFGKADPQRLDPDINFARSYTGEDPAPFLLEHIAQARIGEVFDWARPKNERFEWLQQGLARYRAYQAGGGWEPIPSGETLKPGQSDPRVVLVRKRLAVTGDLPASATGSDDPARFDDALEAAVKRFQARHGIEVDGVIGAGTLAAMNVPVADRIDQIRVNLERGRWTLHEAYDQFLVADIAGFDVYWVKDGEIFWKEQIQVGKEYTKTPVFKGEIRYLDFNPTWTIPPGILRRSVIPGLKKDPGYLDKKGYQLLTLDGKPVDSKTVDWNSLNGFPYMVRQPPGPDNALGQVKFMFPNPHFVFLHDTNHRELFDRSKRSFSSGCIRVRNPFELAERLLAGQGEWTREKIDTVVASGRTTRVNLNRPMRIIIAYNTARVPTEGSQVHFRPDIYKRDAKVLAALDGAFRLHKRDSNGGTP